MQVSQPEKDYFMTDTTVTVQELTKRVIDIFRRCGLSTLHADALGRVIAAGERDACKSHGIYRIEGCLRTIKAGKVNPTAQPELTTDDSAIVRVDAQGGYANAAW